MVTRIRTIDFLPEIFQTQSNKQFLGASLDLLVQQRNVEPIQGYLGLRYGSGVSKNDRYLAENNSVRTNYQFEPAVSFLKKDTNTVKDLITYPGIVDSLALDGAVTNNHNNLFEQTSYSWQSYITYDKLVNYQQYYWLPLGPESVLVSTDPVPRQRTFVVTQSDNGYKFQDIKNSNPTLTLLRGGTYRFILNNTSKFWIQGTDNITGTVPNYDNISTREILGVDSNGSSDQEVVFTVPYRDAQSQYEEPNVVGDHSIDLVSSIPYDKIHNRPLRELVDIDGVNELDGKRLIFWGKDTLDYQKKYYKIQYTVQNIITSSTTTVSGTVNPTLSTASLTAGYIVPAGTIPVLGDYTQNASVIIGMKVFETDGTTTTQLGNVIDLKVRVIDNITHTFIETDSTSSYNSTNTYSFTLPDNKLRVSSTTNIYPGQQVTGTGVTTGTTVSNIENNVITFSTDVSAIVIGTVLNFSNDAPSPPVVDTQFDSYPYSEFAESFADPYTNTEANLGFGQEIVIKLIEDGSIPVQERIRALLGTRWQGRDFYRRADTGIIQLIPYLSAKLDRLYYRSNDDENSVGIIDLIESNTTSKIDLSDIISKKVYTSPNKVTFTSGLKVRFEGNVTPSNYLKGEYYVEGVGDAITLIPVDELLTPEPFTELYYIPWDFNYNWDQIAWDAVVDVPIDANYYTISRRSRDRNSWSRSNRWFHGEVLEQTYQHNQSERSLYDLTNISARASRPIIEIVHDIALANTGLSSAGYTDYYDTEISDAFSTVNGMIKQSIQLWGISNDTVRLLTTNTKLKDELIVGQQVKIMLAQDQDGWRTWDERSYYIGNITRTNINLGMVTVHTTNSDTVTVTNSVSQVEPGMTLVQPGDSSTAERRYTIISVDTDTKQITLDQAVTTTLLNQVVVVDGVSFKLYLDTPRAGRTQTSANMPTVVGSASGTGVATFGTLYVDGFEIFNNSRIVFSNDTDQKVRNTVYVIKREEIDAVNDIYAISLIPEITEIANRAQLLVTRGNTTLASAVRTTQPVTDQKVISVTNTNEIVAGMTLTAIGITDLITVVSVDRTNKTITVDLETTLPVNHDIMLQYQQDVINSQETGYNYIHKGRSYVWSSDTLVWSLAQLKRKINQPPLADILNANGISYTNKDYYPDTDFVGCSLFEYAQGLGTTDQVLGFPIKYTSISNIADIVFDITLNSQKFSYNTQQSGATVRKSISVNDGYVYRYYIKDIAQPETGWISSIERSKQYQVITIEGTRAIHTTEIQDQNSTEYTTVILDLRVQADTGWNPIKVYNNNKFLTLGTDFTYQVDNATKTTAVKILGNVIETIVIEVLSNDVSKYSYYSIPSNLANNPLNANPTSIDLGSVRNHWIALCENSGAISGNFYGSNNSRDVAEIERYGNSVIQHSASLLLPAVFARKTDYNFMNTIDWVRDQYTNYKQLIVDLVSQYDFSPYDKPSYILDTVLKRISEVKSDQKSFFWSDMIYAGDPYSQRRYLFKNQAITASYNLTRSYDFTNANYYALSVYLLRTINGREVETQLIRDEHWFLQPGGSSIVVNYIFDRNDIIIVKEWNQTWGTYCPSTPTKLGLHGVYKPGVIIDSTYSVPTEFIIGHDGSYTKLYGPVVDQRLVDPRDIALLEFEQRVYNNLKVISEPSLKITDIKPNVSRQTGYTLAAVKEIEDRGFLNWVGKNRVQFRTNYYQENNPWSYNYRGSTLKITGETITTGHWRSIYKYVYDTDRPHTHPWEMLGFTQQPTWWTSYYGDAPYTKDNLVLWTDISKGIIYNNGNPYIDSRYIKSYLLDYLPVDSQGQLLSPFSLLIKDYDFLKFNSPWESGDHSPTETAYIRSSEYAFNLQKLFALLKPAEYYNYNVDRDRYRYNSNIKQWLWNLRKRLEPANIIVPGNGQAIHSYINWSIDYRLQTGVDAYTELSEILNNLDIRLCYRLAGFSGKNMLDFFAEKASSESSNSSLLIPDDNYSVLLYDNIPEQRIQWNAVVIQKTDEGYSIGGNSLSRTVFRVSYSNNSENKQTITAGRNTVQVSAEFTSESYEVPYGTEFYNVQDVCEFLVRYGNYLKQQGMIFKNTHNGVEYDWSRLCAEFLFWHQQKWIVGSTICLNPIAQRLVIEKDSLVVQPLTKRQQNFVLNQNLSPISIKNLNVYRDGNYFEISVRDDGDTIGQTSMELNSIEHVIVFDNTTVFGDVIYKPDVGVRQTRIIVKGYKTAEWNGYIDAQGFILNQGTVESWSGHKKYPRGSIVEYKNQYWVSKEIVSPSVAFDSEQWLPSDYDQIRVGLLPNPSTEAQESIYFYDITATTFNQEKQQLGFSLIGYRPRDYMSTADFSNTSQVNVYRNMLKGKGTVAQIEAFKNAEFPQGRISYHVYENWAIKSGEFGASKNDNWVEVLLDQQSLNGNPTVLTFTTGTDDSDSNQSVNIFNTQQLINYSRRPRTVDLLPSGSADWTLEQGIPSAGYVNSDDVDWKAYRYQDLNSTAAVQNLLYDEHCWIADRNGTWNVYSPVSIEAVCSQVINNYNNTATIIFDRSHRLVVDDLIVIQGFSDIIDGFYIVQSVPTLQKITVIKSLSVTETQTGTGITSKLVSYRFKDPSKIAELAVFGNEFMGKRYWIDNGGNIINYEPKQWQLLERKERFAQTDFVGNYATGVQGQCDLSIVTIANKQHAFFAVINNNNRVELYTSDSTLITTLPEAQNTQKIVDVKLLGTNITILTESSIKFYNISINNNNYSVSPEFSAAVVTPTDYFYDTNDDIFVTSTEGIEIGMKMISDAFDYEVIVEGINGKNINLSIGVNVTPETKLYFVAANSEIAELFTDATTLAVTEGYAYVGIPSKDLVLVFVDGRYIRTIRAPYTQSGSFGYSIAVSPIKQNGDKVYIGAPKERNTIDTAYVGAVYCYDRDLFNNYYLQQRIENPLPTTLDDTDITIYRYDPNTTSLFGYSLTTNRYGAELIIGAPGHITRSGATDLEGAVVVFTNRAQRWGTIQAKPSRFPLNATIYIDSDRISLINITNITDLVESINNQLTGSGRTAHADVLNESFTITVGSTLADTPENYIDITDHDDGTSMKALGIVPYAISQVIYNHQNSNRSRWGHRVALDEYNMLAITAPTDTKRDATMFDTIDDYDSNDTTFDWGHTRFIDQWPRWGQACVYQYMPAADSGKINNNQVTEGRWVFAEFITDSNILVTDSKLFPRYGEGSLSFKNGAVMIGTPYWYSSDKKLTGRVTVFTNQQQPSYRVVRVPSSSADSNKIQNVSIYNTIDSATVGYLDVVDVEQGRILGIVDEHIDYKSEHDPAGYGDISVAWTDKQIGSHWWDVSKIRVLDSHQSKYNATNSSDIVYNTRAWGNYFVGSEIRIYTWVSSSVAPENYSGPGTVRNVDRYVQSKIHDKNTNSLITIYYFWVLDDTTIYRERNKQLASTVLSQYIRDPISSGIPFIAPLSQRSIAIYNASNLIQSQNTALHIGWSNDQVDRLHTEWSLIRENYTYDFLNGMPPDNDYNTEPAGLYLKLLDSLSGQDRQSRSIPNAQLPELMKSGIGPGQTMFLNRLEALQNLLEYTNSVLANYPVVESRQFSYLMIANTSENWDTRYWWKYKNYWTQGYSDSVVPKVEVQSVPELATVQAVDNLVARVVASASSRAEYWIYKSKTWSRIGVERGTIEFNSDLWQQEFGNNLSVISKPVRWILRSIFEQIYTNELVIERNRSLILLFNYIMTTGQQRKNYLTWLNKTSLVDVGYTVRQLLPYEQYLEDNTDFIKGYINEVKPYHVTFKDFSYRYDGIDSMSGTFSDFDLPPVYSSKTNDFRSPQLTYINNYEDNNYLPNSSIWATSTYKDWKQNTGLIASNVEVADITFTTVKQYIGYDADVIKLSNTYGMPNSGTIKINNEIINYDNIDHYRGELSAITRAQQNTAIAEHMPGSSVIVLFAAVQVIDRGRAYTEPPKVTVSYNNPYSAAIEHPQSQLDFDVFAVSDNTGNYPSVTEFNVEKGIVTVITNQDPYPALSGNPATNDGINDRTFDNNYSLARTNRTIKFVYRAGTNTTNPHRVTQDSIGIAINGVILRSPLTDPTKALPNGTELAPDGFVYDWVFNSSYFKPDLSLAAPDSNGEYSYRSGTYIYTGLNDQRAILSSGYLSDENYNGDYMRHSDGHSKVIGWSYDGYPIYGPYGYINPMVASTGTKQILSSYRLRSTELNNRIWTYKERSAGTYVQDWEYIAGLGDLDNFNGRFTVTPDYPLGTYAYFMTFQETDGVPTVPAYPYIVGTSTKDQRTAGDNYITDNITDYLKSFEPTTDIKVTAVLSRDRVYEAVLDNPGQGYNSTAELIVEPAFTEQFASTAFEGTSLVPSNKIILATTKLITGDLVRYTVGSNSVAPTGLVANAYYYVRVDTANNSIMMFTNHASATSKPGEVNYYRHRVMIGGDAQGTEHFLAQCARLQLFMTARPIRQLHTTIKLDRTGYRSEIKPWVAGEIYAGPYVDSLGLAGASTLASGKNFGANSNSEVNLDTIAVNTPYTVTVTPIVNFISNQTVRLTALNVWSPVWQSVEYFEDGGNSQYVTTSSSTEYKIVSATNTNPAIITLDQAHTLIDGEYVNISGITGLALLNNINCYIKTSSLGLTNKQLELYSDQLLNTAINTTADSIYQWGGTLRTLKSFVVKGNAIADITAGQRIRLDNSSGYTMTVDSSQYSAANLATTVSFTNLLPEPKREGTIMFTPVKVYDNSGFTGNTFRVRGDVTEEIGTGRVIAFDSEAVQRYQIQSVTRTVKNNDIITEIKVSPDLVYQAVTNDTIYVADSETSPTVIATISDVTANATTNTMDLTLLVSNLADVTGTGTYSNWSVNYLLRSSTDGSKISPSANSTVSNVFTRSVTANVTPASESVNITSLTGIESGMYVSGSSFVLDDRVTVSQIDTANGNVILSSPTLWSTDSSANNVITFYPKTVFTGPVTVDLNFNGSFIKAGQIKNTKLEIYAAITNPITITTTASVVYDATFAVNDVSNVFIDQIVTGNNIRPNTKIIDIEQYKINNVTTNIIKLNRFQSEIPAGTELTLAAGWYNRRSYWVRPTSGANYTRVELYYDKFYKAPVLREDFIKLYGTNVNNIVMLAPSPFTIEPTLVSYNSNVYTAIQSSAGSTVVPPQDTANWQIVSLADSRINALDRIEVRYQNQFSSDETFANVSDQRLYLDTEPGRNPAVLIDGIEYPGAVYDGGDLQDVENTASYYDVSLSSPPFKLMNPTFYDVVGGTFDSGYAPPELLAGVFTDKIDMQIQTRPGSAWDWDSVVDSKIQRVGSISINTISATNSANSYLPVRGSGFGTTIDIDEPPALPKIFGNITLGAQADAIVNGTGARIGNILVGQYNAVNRGRIYGAQVLNGGKNYNTPPSVIVDVPRYGNGAPIAVHEGRQSVRAQLSARIKNGRVSSVGIINSGTNYGLTYQTYSTLATTNNELVIANISGIYTDMLLWADKAYNNGSTDNSLTAYTSANNITVTSVDTANSKVTLSSSVTIADQQVVRFQVKPPTVTVVDSEISDIIIVNGGVGYVSTAIPEARVINDRVSSNIAIKIAAISNIAAGGINDGLTFVADSSNSAANAVYANLSAGMRLSSVLDSNGVANATFINIQDVGLVANSSIRDSYTLVSYVDRANNSFTINRKPEWAWYPQGDASNSLALINYNSSRTFVQNQSLVFEPVGVNTDVTLANLSIGGTGFNVYKFTSTSSDRELTNGNIVFANLVQYPVAVELFSQHQFIDLTTPLLGTVSNFADLPTNGAKPGDRYTVTNPVTITYFWTGSAWAPSTNTNEVITSPVFRRLGDAVGNSSSSSIITLSGDYSTAVSENSVIVFSSANTNNSMPSAIDLKNESYTINSVTYNANNTTTIIANTTIPSKTNLAVWVLDSYNTTRVDYDGSNVYNNAAINKLGYSIDYETANIVLGANTVHSNSDIDVYVYELGGGNYLERSSSLVNPVRSSKYSAIEDVTNTNPVVIVTTENHNLIDGQQIRVKYVLGTIELNMNTYYAKTTADPRYFELYSDQALTTSVDGTLWADYTSGGVIDAIDDLSEIWTDVRFSEVFSTVRDPYLSPTSDRDSTQFYYKVYTEPVIYKQTRSTGTWRKLRYYPTATQLITTNSIVNATNTATIQVLDGRRILQGYTMISSKNPVDVTVTNITFNDLTVNYAATITLSTAVTIEYGEQLQFAEYTQITDANNGNEYYIELIPNDPQQRVRIKLKDPVQEDDYLVYALLGRHENNFDSVTGTTQYGYSIPETTLHTWTNTVKSVNITAIDVANSTITVASTDGVYPDMRQVGATDPVPTVISVLDDTQIRLTTTTGLVNGVANFGYDNDISAIIPLTNWIGDSSTLDTNIENAIVELNGYRLADNIRRVKVADGSDSYLSSVPSSLYSRINDIVYTTTNSLNKTFTVTVGDNGVVLVNDDQLDDPTLWYIQNIVTTKNLNSVAVGANHIVAVGDNGTIIYKTLTNSDALLDKGGWNLVANVTTNTLYSVIWTGTEFIAVGDNKTMIHSITPNTWTNVIVTATVPSGHNLFASGTSSYWQYNWRKIIKHDTNYIIVGDNNNLYNTVSPTNTDLDVIATTEATNNYTNTDTIVVDSTANILQGMTVRGSGVPTGTRVFEIDIATNTITLTNTVTVTNYDLLEFGYDYIGLKNISLTNRTVESVGIDGSGRAYLELDNVTDIEQYMVVTGGGINTNIYVIGSATDLGTNFIEVNDITNIVLGDVLAFDTNRILSSNTATNTISITNGRGVFAGMYIKNITSPLTRGTAGINVVSVTKVNEYQWDIECSSVVGLPDTHVVNFHNDITGVILQSTSPTVDSSWTYYDIYDTDREDIASIRSLAVDNNDTLMIVGQTSDFDSGKNAIPLIEGYLDYSNQLAIGSFTPQSLTTVFTSSKSPLTDIVYLDTYKVNFEAFLCVGLYDQLAPYVSTSASVIISGALDTDYSVTREDSQFKGDIQAATVINNKTILVGVHGTVSIADTDIGTGTTIVVDDVYGYDPQDATYGELTVRLNGIERVFGTDWDIVYDSKTEAPRVEFLIPVSIGSVVDITWSDETNQIDSYDIVYYPNSDQSLLYLNVPVEANDKISVTSFRKTSQQSFDTKSITGVTVNSILEISVNSITGIATVTTVNDNLFVEGQTVRINRTKNNLWDNTDYTAEIVDTPTGTIHTIDSVINSKQFTITVNNAWKSLKGQGFVFSDGQISMTQPKFIISSKSRTWITVNGQRVSNDNYELYGNQIQLFRDISQNDEIVITSMVPGASPNAQYTSIRLGKWGVAEVVRQHPRTRTWITQNYPIDPHPPEDVLYVADATKIMNIVEVTQQITNGGVTTVKDYRINSAEIVKIEVTGIQDTAKYPYYKPSSNDSIDIYTGLETGTVVTIKIYIGNTVIINGERIRFADVDLTPGLNSISKLTRGVDNTAVLSSFKILDVVQSDLPQHRMNKDYWQYSWTDINNNPVQISTNDAAEFLRRGWE